MDNQHLKALLDRLSGYSALAMEHGVAFASARSHYEVCIEHIVIKMLEEGGGDIDRALHFFDVDQDSLWSDLLQSLAERRAGNSGRPSLSPYVLQWLDQAWVSATLHYGHENIRSIALLDALIQMAPSLAGNPFAQVSSIPLERLRQQCLSICEQSVEVIPDHSDNPDRGALRKADNHVSDQKKKAVGAGDSALERFTDNLTLSAGEGKMDPVLGRDAEVRSMIDIITRRRKNNPLLVGEPGVGKTAVVEGLAQRIAAGKVPELLRNVELRALDLGRLKAGAGVKGEFEKRLKQVIEEAKAWHCPVILFIDEAHTLIGAGGEAGLGDAANLLKPALARGELKTIAATTWSEYKQYFESDSALERRFQVIKVEEPDIEQAMVMLSGLKDRYAQHHEVHITDAAIAAAVRLSSRYINGRQLPDKAIDLLDTASARVRMGQSVEPGIIETERAHLEYLHRRLAQLEVDANLGIPVEDGRIDTIREEIEATEERLSGWGSRWESELGLVETIRGMAGEKTDIHRSELAALQGDHPMVEPDVDAGAVAAVVSEWTGVPLGRMVKSDIDVLANYEEQLAERVVGQEDAHGIIANGLRMARAGLNRENAPVGVFLLAGPSGVGKTETALAIADTMFGGERFLVSINMSEYQEAHTVSQLKGSPPGYVGYGKGGVLTEAVRQRPHSVILLDEVEKAHPDVVNLFYQVFDKGFMRDGEGREIDFRNTIIFMTSNLGAEAIIDAHRREENVTEVVEGEAMAESVDNTLQPSMSELVEKVRPHLLQRFAPALLGRVQIVPYRTLGSEAMQSIVALKLDQAAGRLQDAHGIELRCERSVIDHLAEQCSQTDAGARYVHTLLEQRLLPGIARRLLAFMADGEVPSTVALSIDESQGLVCDFLVKNDQTAGSEPEPAVAVS